MAQNLDVGSLLRQLVGGFAAGEDTVGKTAQSTMKPKTSVAVAHDEAMGVVVVTLALMAQEAAAERQYASRRNAIEHIRPL
jgi:vacuolar-type H+-ATPase subunit D/Vma8